MKKVLSFFAIFMMFTSVVVAASVNGNFEGNPIVKLKANGQEIKAKDVPAIIYNGRTMVPIYMLEELGFDVSWDQKTYTVNISQQQYQAPINQNEDIERLKLYSRIAEHYRKIMALGDSITDTSQDLSLAFDAIRLRNSNEGLKTSLTNINKIIDAYNRFLTITQNIVEEAQSSDIDISDMNDILSAYSKGIDYYKEAYKFLEKYYYSYEPNDFYNYLDASGKGFDTAFPGKEKALDGYFKFYNMIQTY